MTTAAAEQRDRAGSGRKKIPIEKIERSENRKVTFSKRRTGLFKKASEVCNSCAARIAIVVFSQAGRLFTFGCPSVDAVVGPFLRQSGGVVMDENEEEGGDGVVLDLFTRRRELEGEKRRGELLGRMLRRKAEWGEGDYWCEEDVEGLGEEGLKDSKEALGILKRKVASKLDDYDRFLTLRL